MYRKAHIFFIAALGFVAYENSFDCSFHFDDFFNITENPAVRIFGSSPDFPFDVAGLKAIWNFAPTRFIGILSFALNYHFNRLDVFGYHVVNFLIHIGSAIAVWKLVQLLFATPVMMYGRRDIKCYVSTSTATVSLKDVAALVCALLFVSHPVQTQAVTYIVQRCTSLAALLYLVTLCLYLEARLTGIWWRRNLFFSGAAVTALLAMLTKETVFTLPFAIILFEFAFFNNGTRMSADSADLHRFKLKDIIRVYLLYPRKSAFHETDHGKYRYTILLVLILCAFALIIPALLSFDIRDIFGAEVSARLNDPPLTVSVYLMTQFRVLVTYLRLLVLPINQNIDYDFPASTSFFEIHTLLSFIFLAALFCCALAVFSRNRLIGVGILWFFLTLAVGSSIAPNEDVIAEHRLYLPMVGYCFVMTGVFISPVWKNRTWLAAALFLCIVSTNTSLTFRRNTVWKDEESLWSDSVEKSPYKDRPYINLAGYYREMGSFDKAQELYARVLRFNSENAQVYYNLGDISFREGRIEEAKSYFMRVLSINPDNSYAYNYLGTIFDGEGNTGEAQRHYEKALELDPEFACAHKNLGALYHREGMPEKALEQYSDALKINPYDSEAHNSIGIISSEIGNGGKAIEHWSEAIRLSPDYAEAFKNYAWFLATTTDDRYRNPIHAVIYAEMACEITGFQNPKYLDTLAAAYADNGRFIEARETAEKALGMLKDPHDRLALDIARRLDNYERRVPYREEK